MYKTTLFVGWFVLKKVDNKIYELTSLGLPQYPHLCPYVTQINNTRQFAQLFGVGYVLQIFFYVPAKFQYPSTHYLLNSAGSVHHNRHFAHFWADSTQRPPWHTCPITKNRFNTAKFRWAQGYFFFEPEIKLNTHHVKIRKNCFKLTAKNLIYGLLANNLFRTGNCITCIYAKQLNPNCLCFTPTEYIRRVCAKFPITQHTLYLNPLDGYPVMCAGSFSLFTVALTRIYSYNIIWRQWFVS